MMALQVQVKKKETERQQEMRLRSFAYLKQLEDQEVWKELHLHSSSTNAAHKLRLDKMLKPQERLLPMDMSPTAYLASLVPGKSNCQGTPCLCCNTDTTTFVVSGRAWISSAAT